MKNEEILKRVEEIKEISAKSKLNKAAAAALKMSTCEDLYTMQVFLQGLHKALNNEGNAMINIWSNAYDITNSKEEDKNDDTV